MDSRAQLTGDFTGFTGIEQDGLWKLLFTTIQPETLNLIWLSYKYGNGNEHKYTIKLLS